MVIRIVHQPSGAAAGMAGYMTGRGKARQRQQKYSMDLWEQERKIQARQQQQFAGAKYRAALGGTRGQGGVGQQAAGQWEDPFELAVAAGDTKKAVQIKAQRKRDARRQRLGEDPLYPEAQQKFLPAPTKEQVRRKQELEDKKLAREQKVADTAAQRKYQKEQSEQTRQHQRDMEIDNDLQSGDLVLTPFAEKEIRKARDNYAKAESSGNYSPEQLDELRQKTGERVRKLKRSGSTRPETPSAVDVVAGNVVVIDKDTGQPRKTQEGERPEYQVIDGKLVPIPLPAKQKAESEAAEKSTTDTLKEFAKLREDKDEFGKRTHTDADALKAAKEKTAAIELARRQLDADASGGMGPAEQTIRAMGVGMRNAEQPSDTPQPQSKAERDQLPPGTEYIAPDGQKRTTRDPTIQEILDEGEPTIEQTIERDWEKRRKRNQ